MLEQDRKSVAVFCCIIIAAPVLCVFPAFCPAEENLVITTYYPSPYGTYNALATNKFAVGDTNGDLALNDADQPPADGQVYAARGVIFKPQGSLPAFDAMPGEVVYHQPDNKFYFFDGNTSVWASLGSGGSCYTDYALAAALPVGAACTVNGYKVKGDLGSWGACYSDGPWPPISGRAASFAAIFSPPGGNCSSWNYASLGTAYLCCE